MTIYAPNLAAWLTAIFIVAKVLQTKTGAAFLRYVTGIPQKELVKKVDEHEMKINNINVRLEKGDEKFQKLSEDIKKGDAASKDRLDDIHGIVSTILENMVKK